MLENGRRVLVYPRKSIASSNVPLNPGDGGALSVASCRPPAMARSQFTEGPYLMPTAEGRAATILAEFHKAEVELVGTAVILTDGKAGTVEHVWLDELHGLRISVRGHEGKWPVSTIKLAQAEPDGCNERHPQQPHRS